MESQPPHKKGADPPPQFSAHFYSGQAAGCLKMPLGMEVGLSRGDFVLDEHPGPLPKRGRAPNFRPMFIVAKRLCGSRWHLARRWALSRPHCARWGPSSPSPQKGQPPQFSAYVYCGQTAGCINMPLCMEVGLSSGDFVLDGDPAPLPKRGGAPNFRPTSIVAKRVAG